LYKIIDLKEVEAYKNQEDLMMIKEIIEEVIVANSAEEAEITEIEEIKEETGGIVLEEVEEQEEAGVAIEKDFLLWMI
jgi:hypothetical protein